MSEPLAVPQAESLESTRGRLTPYTPSDLGRLLGEVGEKHAEMLRVYQSMTHDGERAQLGGSEEQQAALISLCGQLLGITAELDQLAGDLLMMTVASGLVHRLERETSQMHRWLQLSTLAQTRTMLDMAILREALD